jgi:hypothetical protein
MHWLGRLGAVVVALSPVVGRADLVAPHDQSFTDGNCENCHNLYDTTTLGALDYSTGCNSCHAGKTASTLAFPRTDLEAKPGVKGTHHSWSGFAENPAYGATAPTATTLSTRLVDGRLQCSVCHDLHVDASSNAPWALHASPDVGVATAPTSGTGTAKLTITVPGTISRGYRIKLVGPTSYIITRSFGATPIAWMNWDTGTAKWVAGVDNGTARTFVPGTDYVLDDAAGMSVRWSAAGNPGDQWDVLVSYPGLRMTMADDQMCTHCHKPMAMTTARVAGNDPAYQVDGTRVFGHPTGEALGSNGLGSDRAEILDANGATQTVGDGNATNDLKLKGGVVRCTTCHAVHGADSNSLTTDVR